MGQGYEFKCKCGYSFNPFLGVGFLFPKVYQKRKDSAQKGEYGRELKEFFSEHPEGAIDAAMVVVKCQKCGDYSCVPNLSMYLPKTKEKRQKGRWSVAMPFEGDDYVAPWELSESYTLFAKYQHTCKSCGGDMDIVPEDDLEKNGIVCPRCGKSVSSEETIMWD